MDAQPQLDETLVYLTKRKPSERSLTPEQCIALNLLWRKGVRVPLLAKVFGVGRNTVYYRALTGDADSYPTSSRSNSAADTNALIDRMGEEAAWKAFVTPAQIEAVNAANEKLVKRRQRARR